MASRKRENSLAVTTLVTWRLGGMTVHTISEMFGVRLNKLHKGKLHLEDVFFK